MSLLLILFLACKEPEESPPICLLGTGEWEWEELDEGSGIPVIQGPQGGFHLLGSVRISGLEAGNPDSLGHPSNPTTAFHVWLDGEELAPTATYVQGLDPIPGEGEFTAEMVGRFAILDIASDDELDGAELLFEVEIRDVDGRTASHSVGVVGFPHPSNN
jgi:hypothetical protein